MSIIIIIIIIIIVFIIIIIVTLIIFIIVILIIRGVHGQVLWPGADTGVRKEEMVWYRQQTGWRP